MIKRIIFDVDGTLIPGVDFSPYITRSLEKVGIESQGKAALFLAAVSEYEKTHIGYERDLYVNFFSSKLGVSFNQKFL